MVMRYKHAALRFCMQSLHSGCCCYTLSMAVVMLLYDLGGLLTLLGGMLLLCGLVAAFLYAIILQVGYIVAAWRSGISLWRKLLVPIVMAAWALPPVIAVSIKTLSVRSGLALEAWQWCVSALGVGVLWGGLRVAFQLATQYRCVFGDFCRLYSDVVGLCPETA